MNKYKNICNKDGTLIRLIYENRDEDDDDDEFENDESECNDNYVDIEVIHQHEDETETGYCTDYYCDESDDIDIDLDTDTDTDTDTNENQPNITTLYEKPEVIDSTATLNYNLAWLLPLIAVLAILTIIIYCLLLKPPNIEKYDKIEPEPETTAIYL